MDVRRIYDETYYHYCRAADEYEAAKRRYPDLYNNVICAERSVDCTEIRIEYLVYHGLDTTDALNQFNTSVRVRDDALNILLSHVYPEYEQWLFAKANYEDAQRQYYA